MNILIRIYRYEYASEQGDKDHWLLTFTFHYMQIYEKCMKTIQVIINIYAIPIRC